MRPASLTSVVELDLNSTDRPLSKTNHIRHGVLTTPEYSNASSRLKD